MFVVSLLVVVGALCALLVIPNADGMEAPLIGILSQETYSVNHLFPDEQFHSLIAASYVKFVESAGARVVPIWIGRDRAYYERIVNSTNGVLLPGGATWFNQSDGYADAAQHLYDIAVELNDRGDYYPVWGTCLGMEVLIQVSLGGQEIRGNCDAKKISMPLQFVANFRDSKLFSKAPDHIVNILSSQNVTYNYHTFCFTDAIFTQYELNDQWRTLAHNHDKNGLEFISVYEAHHYPFYGVQFHPEKNPFEFKQMAPILEHGDSAIEASQYFGRFIANEARKSRHEGFASKEQLERALIYNYAPRYTAKLGGSYEQLYMFTKIENDQPLD